MKNVLKGGNAMVILGFMFLIIGLFVISGAYGIYAYVIDDIIKTELYEASIAILVVIPGILLVAFLALTITSVIMMQRGKKWQLYYIIAMVFYFVVIIFYYTSTPEPLKDLIIFTNFCFIVSTISLFFGQARLKKKLAKEAEENVN